MCGTIQFHRYKLSDEASTLKMKKLYFFWVCPDTKAFEWFADLLRTIENQVYGDHYIECIHCYSTLLLQLLNKGINDFLEYHIYLTRGWKASDVSSIDTHSILTSYGATYFKSTL